MNERSNQLRESKDRAIPVIGIRGSRTIEEHNALWARIMNAARLPT
jgi:hypothetical protein